MQKLDRDPAGSLPPREVRRAGARLPPPATRRRSSTAQSRSSTTRTGITASASSSTSIPSSTEGSNPLPLRLVYRNPRNRRVSGFGCRAYQWRQRQAAIISNIDRDDLSPSETATIVSLRMSSSRSSPSRSTRRFRRTRRRSRPRVATKRARLPDRRRPRGRRATPGSRASSSDGSDAVPPAQPTNRGGRGYHHVPRGDEQAARRIAAFEVAACRGGRRSCAQISRRQLWREHDCGRGRREGRCGRPRERTDHYSARRACAAARDRSAAKVAHGE